MIKIFESSFRIYLPIYNAVAWAKSFEIPQGVKIIAVDNASTDGTADVLQNRGIDVIRHPRNIGRVENWDFCLRHFIASDALWVKLHMAGDTIYPQTQQVLQNVVFEEPTARFVTAGWDICQQEETRPVRRFDKVALVAPADALRRLAEEGNWIGPPLNNFIHRDLLKTGFNLGDHPWVADMELFLQCARQHSVVLAPGTVGCFNVSERRYYSKQVNAFKSRCEEAIVRYKAATLYKELTGNETIFNDITRRIDRDVERLSVESIISRHFEASSLSHILDPVPTRHLLVALGRRISKRFRQKLQQKTTVITSKILGERKTAVLQSWIENRKYGQDVGGPSKRKTRFQTSKGQRSIQIAQILHSFEPRYLNQAEVQIPRTLIKLLPATWSAYITRPTRHLADFPEIPLIGVGDPIYDQAWVVNPNLTNLSDTEFDKLNAPRAAEYGNFLILTGGSDWFSANTLRTVAAFRASCAARGETGFIYLKIATANIHTKSLLEDLEKPKGLDGWRNRDCATHLLRTIDLVSFQSEETAVIARRAFPKSASKFIVVQNCIADSFLKYLPASPHTDRKNRVLAATRKWGDQKDIVALIQGFREFQKLHPNWKLDLIGEVNPNFVDEFRTLTDDLVSMGAIIVHGPIAKEDRLSDFYLNAGIFLTTDRETWTTNSPIEAAAFGCPIVSSHGAEADLREIVGDRIDLATIAGSSPESIRFGLERLATNPKLQREYSGWISERSENIFRWEKQLKKVADAALA
jgi:glycosyltransferase involved in cell wall biosynthesis